MQKMTEWQFSFRKHSLLVFPLNTLLLLLLVRFMISKWNVDNFCP